MVITWLPIATGDSGSSLIFCRETVSSFTLIVLYSVNQHSKKDETTFIGLNITSGVVRGSSLTPNESLLHIFHFSGPQGRMRQMLGNHSANLVFPCAKTWKVQLRLWSGMGGWGTAAQFLLCVLGWVHWHLSSWFHKFSLSNTRDRIHQPHLWTNWDMGSENS